MPTSNPRTRPSFAALAQNLTTVVSTSGDSGHACLPEGLEIVMQRSAESCQNRRWRLALAREHRYPSDDEVENCRHAFKVPDGVAERRLERCRTHPKSQRRIRYHIIELTWTELMNPDPLVRA